MGNTETHDSKRPSFTAIHGVTKACPAGGWTAVVEIKETGNRLRPFGPLMTARSMDTCSQCTLCLSATNIRKGTVDECVLDVQELAVETIAHRVRGVVNIVVEPSNNA